MSSALIIRKASPDDVPLIRRLAERTWWPTYRSILSEAQIRYMLDTLYSVEALSEQMERGHSFLFVYEQNQPLGFASWSASEDPGYGKLHKLYVVPEAQGKGAGRFLLKAVEEEARRKSCNLLELNVNRFNPARRFYEKAGFTIVREADLPIGPFFMNDYVMQKNLR